MSLLSWKIGDVMISSGYDHTLMDQCNCFELSLSLGPAPSTSRMNGTPASCKHEEGTVGGMTDLSHMYTSKSMMFPTQWVHHRRPHTGLDSCPYIADEHKVWTCHRTLRYTPQRRSWNSAWFSSSSHIHSIMFNSSWQQIIGADLIVHITHLQICQQRTKKKRAQFDPLGPWGSDTPSARRSVVLRRGKRLVYWYTGFQAHHDQPVNGHSTSEAQAASTTIVKRVEPTTVKRDKPCSCINIPKTDNRSTNCTQRRGWSVVIEPQKNPTQVGTQHWVCSAAVKWTPTGGYARDKAQADTALFTSKHTPRPRPHRAELCPTHTP